MVKQLGIPLGAYLVMVDHILTDGKKSGDGIQPEVTINANNIAIEVYQDTAFLLGVELVVECLSLFALRYQPYFKPRNRIYVVYGLIIRRNLTYFNTYHLDRLLPTKPTKNK